MYNPDKLNLFAGYLSNNYGLDITTTEARADLLKGFEMTLVASGNAISIGGTAANASIQQEIGALRGFSTPFTATASMNDSSLRSLAGFPTAGSTISMSNFYGKASFTGYYAAVANVTLTNASDGMLVARDNSGNLFATAHNNYSTLALNTTNGIRWQSKYTQIKIKATLVYSTTPLMFRIGQDSASNGIVVACVGAADGTTAGKWCKKYLFTGLSTPYIYQSTCDLGAAGDVYVGGTNPFAPSGGNSAFLIKYSMSGTLMFHKVFTTTTWVNVVAVAERGSYLWVIFSYQNTLVYQFIYLYDTSGTLLGKYRMTDGTNTHEIYYSCMKASGTDMYLTGQTEVGKPVLIKVSAAMTPTWARIITAGMGLPKAMAVTTDGSVWIVDSTGIMAKYNSSGVFQFGRTFTMTNMIVTTMIADGNNIVLGYKSNAGNAIARIRSDGTIVPTAFSVSGVSGSYAEAPITETAMTVAFQSNVNVNPAITEVAAGGASSDLVQAATAETFTITQTIL